VVQSMYFAKACGGTYGWSPLVTGHKQAEMAEAKPSQNLLLHSKTTLKPQNT